MFVTKTDLAGYFFYGQAAVLQKNLGYLHFFFKM